jgi:hypothetical protein
MLLGKEAKGEAAVGAGADAGAGAAKGFSKAAGMLVA